jgi:hypothetical protein
MHTLSEKVFAATFLVFTGVLFSTTMFAWTGPSTTAPGGNVSAPVNVGATSQVKSGGLWVGSLGVSGGTEFDGKVGIGMAPSSSWALSITNTTYGIWSKATGGGYAVYGDQGGNGYGVYGYAPSTGGVGVRGDGSAYGGMFRDSDNGVTAYVGYGSYGLYTGNIVRADGGFCISGSCITSWPGRGSSYWSDWIYIAGQGTPSVQCSSGYVMTGIQTYETNGDYRVDQLRILCTN